LLGLNLGEVYVQDQCALSGKCGRRMVSRRQQRAGGKTGDTMANRRTKEQRRQLDLIREAITQRELSIQQQIEALGRELDELAEADQALLKAM
jgi:hypothetical protein